MLEILTRITEGQGTMEDLERLEVLSKEMADAALCALGQLTPNPVLTTLKYLRDEYIVHIVEKRCPVLRCEALISLSTYSLTNVRTVASAGEPAPPRR